MNYQIIEINDNELKAKYTKEILDKLPEWFGMPEGIKEYVNNVHKYPYWAAIQSDKCIGFFSGKIHHQRTGDIYVCGVSPEFHNRGIGKALFHKMEEYFKKINCDYIIVKTLSDIANYEPYLRTKKFYHSIGFTELVTLTEMWDERNPCLIMIKDIKS